MKDFSRSRALFERAARVIPGGIYGSKAPGAMVAGAYPYYLESGKGCRIRDVDGNEFIDFMCGYGSQIVGYGNEAVDAAGLPRIAAGDLLPQPSPVMVDLAERLLPRFEGAAWTIFTKNGTDATSLALSLARVHTEKPLVLAAEGAYHGAANWSPMNPYPPLRKEREDMRSFRWNDLGGLESLFEREGGRIAAVIVTPYHHPTFAPQVLPDPRLFPLLRRLCDDEGALLVLDDIRANFRLHPKGSHLRFGARPDLWTAGKALGNGYPISALLGVEAFRKAASSLFVTGTYWMNAGPMAASLACLEEMERLGGVERLEALGTRLARGLEEGGRAEGFGAKVSGPPAIPFLTFDEDPDLYLNQRFGAAMARRGVWVHPHHNWFLSLAHREEDIDEALGAAREAFAAMRRGEE